LKADSEQRLYNGRMENFDKYIYINGNVICCEPYGLILIVDEQIYYYQNEAVE